MFDIGFLELLVVAVIGLLVMGPERLPGAIRTGALWLGRLRRSFSQIKSEIEREIDADEIRRQLQNEEIMQTLRDSKKELQKHTDIRGEINQLEKSFNNTNATNTNTKPDNLSDHPPTSQSDER